MTIETTTSFSPERVLREARDFFTGRDSAYQASISEESETHIAFATFRSRLVVSAFPDPREEAPTRVRVSTLREDSIAGKFITYIRTAAHGRIEGEAVENA